MGDAESVARQHLMNCPQGRFSAPRLLGSIIGVYDRHCEPPGRANARPMTGSAKQSTLSLLGEMDCFASLAMTVHEYGSASSPRNAPEPLKILPPGRGRRERRVLAAPAVSCAKLCEETHTSIQVQSEHSGVPAQWLYGLCRALPGDEFVLSPSSADEGFAEPGWVRKTSADLTPATGARTTRFCRTRLRRSSCALLSAHGKPALRTHTRRRCRVHRILPHVRDDARPPLLPGKDGASW